MYKNISDCHNHSNISYDGKDSPRDLCIKASSLGLIHHTITDHCECEEYDKQGRDYRSVVDKSHRALLELKEEFPALLIGIELGQPLQNPSAVEDVFSLREYDFVIGSLHSMQNCKDFYYWNKMNMEVYDALDRYFAELPSMVKAGGFDSLGHLSYPLRYICGENGLHVDMNRYDEPIRELFSLMVDNGIALELNTSGLRQKIGCTLPDINYIKLYRSLGGQMVTIGSDAHRCEDLGQGIVSGLQLLESAGFTHYTVFKKREPIYVKIQ